MSNKTFIVWSSDEKKEERSALKCTDIHSLSVKIPAYNDRKFTPCDLRKWIYDHKILKSELIADNIKNLLLDGFTWKPNIVSGVDFRLKDILECPYFLISIEKTIDHVQNVAQKMLTDNELLLRGATGDSKAAIEYCKKEFAREIMRSLYTE